MLRKQNKTKEKEKDDAQYMHKIEDPQYEVYKESINRW